MTHKKNNAYGKWLVRKKSSLMKKNTWEYVKMNEISTCLVQKIKPVKVYTKSKGKCIQLCNENTICDNKWIKPLIMGKKQNQTIII